MIVAVVAARLAAGGAPSPLTPPAFAAVAAQRSFCTGILVRCRLSRERPTHLGSQRRGPLPRPAGERVSLALRMALQSPSRAAAACY